MTSLNITVIRWTFLTCRDYKNIIQQSLYDSNTWSITCKGAETDAPECIRRPLKSLLEVRLREKNEGKKIILAASLETNLKPWKCNIINTKRHWVIPSCFNTVSLYIHVEQPPCSESVCGSTMPLLGEFTHDCLCRGFPCQVDVLCNHKSLMEHSVCFLKTHQAAPEDSVERLQPMERRRAVVASDSQIKQSSASPHLCTSALLFLT